MKISFQWLMQLCPVELTAEEVAGLLTFCGLETESITTYESVPGMLKGLVVGEVVEKQKHANADKLSVCKVSTGKDILQIVCGAGNVAAGQKVVVALPGTVIHPVNGQPFEIKKSKIRGEISEGMICAEDEIGLGTSHEGIMVLPENAEAGKPVYEYFSDKLFSDTVFEIGLTPNRGDAASHAGVARDLVAVINHRFPKVNHASVQLLMPEYSEGMYGTFECPVKVTVQNTEACLRYSGLLIEGVKVSESPAWLRHRLLAIGLKPINNVVDITNFVLHESGQPLHAFDADKISGNHIIVKNLPKDTVFVTLDGIERKLNGNELMICDEEGGLCIAGVFGGIKSGITADTTRVFLESACFLPASIRNTSKFHNLKTDASFRFERGADIEWTLPALFRAAKLIKEIAGGKISMPLDWRKSPFRPVIINFNPSKACELMGFDLAPSKMEEILKTLGYQIEKEAHAQEWKVTVPSFKTEIRNLADVTGEVLRIYGFDNIPLYEKMHLPLPRKTIEPKEVLQHKISSFLVANGFIEMMNNSLVPENDNGKQVKLINPVSNEHRALRSEMISSGLGAMSYNLNRKNHLLRLFETGRVYQHAENGFSEFNCLSLFMTAGRYPESWIEMKPDENNFFTLKSIVIQMLGFAGIKTDTLQFHRDNHPMFDFAVQVKGADKSFGTAGYLSRSLLRKSEIETDVLCAVIDLEQCVLLVAEKRDIAEPFLYPVVKRDLALLIDQNVSYRELEQVAFTTLPDLLVKVSVFDIYKGNNIPEAKISIGLSFYLQDHKKTLTDKQIEKAMANLIAAFASRVGAEIRK